MAIPDKLKDAFKNKAVRVALIAAAALLLLFGVYKVFFGKKTTSEYSSTPQEARLERLLERVEGVKSTTVMITEAEGAAVSAVIVFEGEDGFLTRMRLQKIAASALNIGQSAVVVYPSDK